MKEKSSSTKKQVAMKGDDLVFPIIALLFALYYFYTIFDLTWEAQINGLMVGSILIILVLIFLVKTGLEVIRGEANLRSITLFRFNRLQVIKLGLLLLAIFYVLIIPWAGYTITTFTFLVGAMLVLGVFSPLKLLGISLALSLTGYYFFIELLDTRFAPGPFENLIKWFL